jgi:uncharacterized DUF497 family protein
MQPEDEFEWDKDNEEKLAARHGVDRYEAEQAAVDFGASVKRIGTDRAGNPEYVFVGKTDDGRILFMVGVRKRGRIWLETQSSRRKERTEGETDEPRTEANRQS